MSNLKIPIAPQLIPPMIVKISAILSIIFKKITPFSILCAKRSDFIHFMHSLKICLLNFLNSRNDNFNVTFDCVIAVSCRHKIRVALFSGLAVNFAVAVRYENMVKAVLIGGKSDVACDFVSVNGE